jgi:hypothetical protein
MVLERKGDGVTLPQHGAAPTPSAGDRPGPCVRYTVGALLAHCCYTVVTLSLHCRYTVVTLLLHRPPVTV